MVLGGKCIRKLFIPVSLENCIFLAVRKVVPKKEMARHCRRQTRGVEKTSNCYDRLFIGKGKFGKVTLVLPFIAKCLLQLDNSMQKLSMRQTLFPHLIRPNLSCFYYNSNLFFGRNDSTNFYHFFGQFL